MSFDNYPSRLMLKSLEVAQWLGGQGIVEKTGKNDGPFIEFCLSRVGRIKGDAYCAAFVYTVVEVSGFIIGRDKSPLKKTGLVLAMRRDLEKFNCFHPKATITDTQTLPPGCLAIWDYGNGKGHIGFVTKGSVSSNAFETVEGNHSNKITHVTRKLTDANLVGFGVYP